jgi:hypothetical protein
LSDLPGNEREEFESRIGQAVARAKELHEACVAEVDRRMRPA